MPNEDYEPTDREDDVIDVMAEEGRVNPLLLRERTGYGKGDINTALSNLRAAGWITRVTRGLYEFVEDPRVEAAEDAEAEAPPEPAEDVPPVARPDVDTDIEAAARELVADRPPKKPHAKDIVVETLLLLREHGQLETGVIQENVYPGNEEHYSTERTMWNAVSRYLEDIPGFEKTDGYGGWAYAGDAVLWEAIDDT
jgi:hypothetical protein